MSETTYRFNRTQLHNALTNAIELYLEFRYRHQLDDATARLAGVGEVLEGLDADRCLAADGPTGRLKLQLADAEALIDAQSVALGLARAEIAYLAVPYNDPDPVVRQARFELINRVVARLMSRGIYVFSPISQCHPIAQTGDLPTGRDYWQGYDQAMLEACAELYVLMLDGWDRSVGVQSEIATAKRYGMPIHYLLPE